MQHKEGEMNTSGKGKPMRVNVGNTVDRVLIVMEPCPNCGNSVIAPLTVEMSVKIREMLETTEHKISGTIIIK